MVTTRATSRQPVHCNAFHPEVRWTPSSTWSWSAAARPGAPGGRPGGRSVEPKPFNGKILGAELANLEPPYSASPLGVPITQADYRWLSLVARHPRGALRVLSLGLRWLAGRATGKHLL